jgi:ribosomal protein L40E
MGFIIAQQSTIEVISMQLQTLKCPACGSPIQGQVKPNCQFDCPSCGSALILTDLAAADQIICPGCQRANDAALRFCEGCGASLKTACPFCYAENDADAEHCVNCGVNLLHARQRKQAWLEGQRRNEVERLAALKQAEARSHQARLQELLKDLDEPEKHPMAIYCLHEYGAEAVAPLIARLKDNDPDARYGAAQALGLIGDPRAIEPLVDVLNDPEAAVRYWAVDALGKLRAESAAEAMGNLLHDRHKGVRAHTAQVLQQVGGKAWHVLERNKRSWWPL